MIDFKKRAEQMKASRELGRCVCSMAYAPFPCCCKYQKTFNICHCAGEELKEWDIMEDWFNFNREK